jgi:threonine-phosphate decarboxylase
MIADYPSHGGQLRQIAEQFNVSVSELLDFSANINPAGPPGSVLVALRAALNDPSTLTAYPDLQHHELKHALAQYAGVHESNVVVANGFVPLLETTLRTLKVRACVLPVPAFIEYRRTLERAGVAVAPCTLSPPNFRCDQSMLAENADAILLANPQNPSGVCHNVENIRAIVADAAKRGMLVMLDEAFIDYIPESSLSAVVDEYRNLIVFRSVTKFHGIPGLRVAYAITNRRLSSTIEDELPPWPITTLASCGAIAALEDRTYALRSLAENTASRTELEAGLTSLGLTVYPSSANFLLFALPPHIDPGEFWNHMVLEHRIVLRSCANYEGLSLGHFRTAVKTRDDNKRLVIAIAKTLSSRG